MVIIGASLATIALLSACASNTLDASTWKPIPTVSVKRSARHPGPYFSTLLVANINGYSVLGFGIPTSGGNIAPIQEISGVATQLNALISSIAVDSMGNIWTSQFGETYLQRYTDGSTGNASPDRVLITTGWDDLGVAVDSDGNVWASAAAADFSGTQAINEYDGYPLTPPIRTIEGSFLTNPWGMAFDTLGNLYVANRYGGNIGSILILSSSNGYVSPIAKIKGPNTQLQNPSQIAIDSSGRVIVSSYFPQGRVIVFNSGATGDATPSAVITTVHNPGGVAVDASGNIYVSEEVNNKIFEFAPDANGNASPLSTITGSNTTLDTPVTLTMSL